MQPAALLLVLSLAVQQPDSLVTRAESLLAAGALPEARRAAEDLQRRRPNDPKVLTLLGRVHLAWPVVGRFRAESLFALATRIAPDDPDPRYYLGHVGLALGADDGEAIARPALVRVLALNPDYRDAWALWLRLYRGDGDRRAALDALALHAGNPTADLKRAQLLVELRSYEEAVSLLKRLRLIRPDDPTPHALLARARFEQGRDTAGTAAYDAALRLAAYDEDSVLWHQVRSIASSAERSRYAAATPRERDAFFRFFWARRDPDLRTAANERLGEHFRRMAEAQRYFALLHPNARYYHSRFMQALWDVSSARSFSVRPSRAEIASLAGAVPCVPELPGVRDWSAFQTFTPRLGEAVGEGSPNLEDALDDRGRVFVRHGRPDLRLVFGGDAETWCYRRPDGWLRVTFARSRTGDMLVTPIVAGESESARRLLETDVASPTPTLRFAFWPATFRGSDGRRTELVLFPDSAAAVAVLLDDRGLEAARDTATDRALHLAAPPGRYLLAIDAVRGERSARFRVGFSLPAYPTGELSVSSVLVATGAAPPVRAALETAAPPRLRLRAAEPMRFYAEAYGLVRAAGTVRYEAVYHFERPGRRGFLGLGGRARVTTIAFEREQPFAPTIIESLVIDPGRLPRGHYRLVLEIRDAVIGTRATSASLEFDLR